ncbi:hypothetical protein ACTXT7_003072 [Hymenolepis weldensis]
MEGQLLKFTNMMKGFQYRWVIVDSRFGVLEYYEREEHKNSYKPRASLSLVYATVCPSDEDSQTFVVNTSQGENIRLKATNARERQLWVNHIRAVAEYHTERANEQASISSLPSLQRPSLLPVRETRPAMLNSSNSDQSFRTHRSGGNRVGRSADRSTEGTTNAANAEASTFVDPYQQLTELFRLLEREGNLLGLEIDVSVIMSTMLRAYWLCTEDLMADSNVTNEIKRHTLEMTRSLKSARSFVCKVRKELNWPPRGREKNIVNTADSLRRPEFVRRVHGMMNENRGNEKTSTRMKKSIGEIIGGYVLAGPTEVPTVIHVHEFSNNGDGVISREGPIMTPQFLPQGLRVSADADACMETLQTIVKPPRIDSVANGRPCVFQQNSALSHKALKTQD